MRFSINGILTQKRHPVNVPLKRYPSLTPGGDLQRPVIHLIRVPKYLR